MFLLGLMGLLILNARKLSDYVKENISFTVFLKDNTKEADIKRMQKDLDATQYVKSTEFITKERAAKEFQETLGEDFVEFIGYNPLLSSIEVRLRAEYANADSLKTIEREFTAYPQVQEVSYQKNLVVLINDNVKKISLIILIFSGLLLAISMVLINNTIRLAVYSKRFIINTMQLVGATRGFIRKPFLIRSVVQGIAGALIAILLLTGMIYAAQRELSEIISLRDVKLVGVLYFFVIMAGALITGISTFFAVNKYLHIKTDNLYY